MGLFRDNNIIYFSYGIYTHIALQLALHHKFLVQGIKLHLDFATLMMFVLLLRRTISKYKGCPVSICKINKIARSYKYPICHKVCNWWFCCCWNNIYIFLFYFRILVPSASSTLKLTLYFPTVG